MRTTKISDLLTRTPVNGTAAIVINQCRCATQLELNTLIEQRNKLKDQATTWMQESSKSNVAKRRNKPLIKRANTDLLALNKKLKPYDEWHRSNKPKDYDHSFRLTVRKIFGADIFKQIELQAKANCDI